MRVGERTSLVNGFRRNQKFLSSTSCRTDSREKKKKPHDDAIIDFSGQWPSLEESIDNASGDEHKSMKKPGKNVFRYGTKRRPVGKFFLYLSYPSRRQ